jgi:hypothetical protein
MKKAKRPRDLFAAPELIPANVHAILNTWDDAADPYAECGRIETELKPLGYTFQWGLSGEPYNLRRIY